MARNLTKLYEWQEEFMNWSMQVFTEMPLSHHLYMAQRVFNTKHIGIKDIIEEERAKLELVVNIDSFIGGKILCLAVIAKYDAYGSSWTFDWRAADSIYDEDGGVKVREALQSEGCMFHVPHDDNDEVETLLQEHMRSAYEETLTEDPLDTTIDQLLAWDFFKAAWMACIKKYLKPALAKDYDGIYIEGWKNNERVYSLVSSSADPAHECSKMDAFLELERAVRLRGVDFKPHRIGYVMVTPAPFAQPGTEARAT